VAAPRSVVQQLVSRPILAGALRNRGQELVQLVRSAIQPDRRTINDIWSKVSELGDAMYVLANLGQPEDAAWILEVMHSRIGDQLDLGGISTREAMALAADVNALPGNDPKKSEIISALITAGLANASTTLDLDAFEALPEQLHSKDLRALATGRARDLIEFELRILGDIGADGVSYIDVILDLRDRARYYSFDVEIDALLESLTGGSDEFLDIDTRPSAPLVVDDNEPPGDIFDHFQSGTL